MKKFMQKIVALAFVALLLPATLSAQTEQTNTTPSNAIDMTAAIELQTMQMLDAPNAVALKNKVSKIITRSGMVDSEGLFALVASITITDDGIVDTGMAQMRVVKADFTLSVVNVIDDVVFGSQSVAMQSTGKDNATALRQLINRINVNDVRFAKLIKDSQQSINDYYNRQMPSLIKKIEAMIAKGEYDKALAAMSMIPESTEQYSTICDMQVEVYNKMLEAEVKKIVTEADLLVRQGKIDEALELCRTANPSSPNYSEVVAFLNRLDAQAAAAEAAALEEQRRKADAARSQAMMAAAAGAAGENIKREMAAKVEAENAPQPVAVTGGAPASNPTNPTAVNTGTKKKRKSLGQILFGL